MNSLMNRLILKTVSLVLVVLFMLAMTACKNENNTTDPDETLQKETVDTEKTDIEEEVDDGMVKVTLDGKNVRKDIVDYMRSMAMVEWTPSEDFSLNGNHGSWGVDLSFKAGTVYRGLPYTRAYSDLEAFLAHLENGVYKGPCGSYDDMPGSNCSTSCNVAWRRYLISTVNATYTYVPGFGNTTVMPVGNYKYIEGNRDTSKIISANTADEIYEAYALCKPADAIVKWSDTKSAGHTRMVASDVVVVRNSDGKINGNKSYITIIEQTNKLTSVQRKKTTWLVDKKYTFSELMTDTYVPITHKVLSNEEIETPYITYVDKNTKDDIAKSLMGTVESNYRISSILMTVKDQSGKTVKEYTADIENGVSKINLRKYTFNLDIASLDAGKYTYTLVANTPCLGSATLLELDFEK